MTTDEPSELWKPPLWLSFVWGFAEATIFFIIPDILLSWAALAGARDGLRSLIAIIAGAVLGGVLMFTLASQSPGPMLQMVESIPFVRATMTERVERDFSTYGATAMLRGPGSGIPYKIYAVTAPDHCGIVTFALMSIPARVERLALSAIVFTVIGWAFKRWIGRHRDTTALLFTLFWLVVYAFYWTAIPAR